MSITLIIAPPRFFSSSFLAFAFGGSVCFSYNQLISENENCGFELHVLARAETWHGDVEANEALQWVGRVFD